MEESASIQATHEEDLFSPRSTAAMALSSLNSRPVMLNFGGSSSTNTTTASHPDFHPPPNNCRRTTNEDQPHRPNSDPFEPSQQHPQFLHRPSPPQHHTQQVFRRPSPPSGGSSSHYHHHYRGVTPNHHNIRRYQYHYENPASGPALPSPWTPPTWSDHHERRMMPVPVYRTTSTSSSTSSVQVHRYPGHASQEPPPPPPPPLPSRKSHSEQQPHPMMCYSGPPSATRAAVPTSGHKLPPPHFYHMSTVTPTPHKRQKTEQVAACFQPPPSSLKTEPRKVSKKSPYNRKKKSLGVLAETFLHKFNQMTDFPQIVIDDLSAEFQVERRRIYDVVNILEGLCVVVKKGKNTYQWMGQQHLSRQFGLLQDEAIKMWKKQAAANGFLPNDPDLVNDTPVSQVGGNKSLTRLSQLFLQVFLVGESNIDLPNASDLIHGGRSSTEELVLLGCKKNEPLPKDEKAIQQAAARGLKTKIRRLYDIANVFLSVGLLRKTESRSANTIEGKRPHYHWNYEHDAKKIREIYLEMESSMSDEKMPLSKDQEMKVIPINAHCVDGLSTEAVDIMSSDDPESKESPPPTNNSVSSKDGPAEVISPEPKASAASSVASSSSSSTPDLEAIQQIKGTESDSCSPDTEKENALSNIHEVGAMEVSMMSSLPDDATTDCE